MLIPPPRSKEINPVVFKVWILNSSYNRTSPDCFFTAQKRSHDEGNLLPSLQHGKNISLITLHSNTGHADATRGSGFGRKCQTSV